MGYPVRCTRCRGRRTLAKHPDSYIIVRYTTCGCGGNLILDSYRYSGNEKKKASVCLCDGWWFPHTKGCKGCHTYLDRYLTASVKGLTGVISKTEEPPF